MAGLTFDEGPFGISWVLDEPLARTSHALADDGRVWFVDPVDEPVAMARAAELGTPAGVIQLLDRHNRDGAAIAGRLGVPHLKAYAAPAPGPFETIGVLSLPLWKEAALWWPARRVLVVAEIVGTNPVWAAGPGPAGIHPMVRMLPPGAMRGYEPQHLLVGHGPGVHGAEAATALRKAYDRSRRDIPASLLKLPGCAPAELEAMLIYSMSVSVDGFIADRDGAFGWTAPSEETFRFHIEEVRELGGFLCGRRLYETMVVWETDPSLRGNEPEAEFADLWCAIPKIVFSRTLDSVQGNARLAEASLAEEAAAMDATDNDVAIGGAGLAAQAVELGLVDELRMFRYPVVIGGGTPFLPPVTEGVPLDLIETRTFGSRVIFERYRRAAAG